MNEILTIEQIQTRYAPDWVLIGDPDTDETLRVRAGKVLFHSPATRMRSAGRWPSTHLGGMPCVSWAPFPTTRCSSSELSVQLATRADLRGSQSDRSATELDPALAARYRGDHQRAEGGGAGRLGLRPGERVDSVPMTTGSAVISVPRLVLTRLTALGHHRFGLPVRGYTLPASASVSGLLGLDFLRDRVLTLDFRAGEITLT